MQVSVIDKSLSRDSGYISSFLVSAVGLLGVLGSECFLYLHFPLYKIRIIGPFLQITAKKKRQNFSKHQICAFFFFCPDYLQ